MQCTTMIEWRPNVEWSNDKPTVPGRYWFRWSLSEPQENWCIFQVWEDEGQMIVSYREQPIDEWVRDYPTGQWCGPIPLPPDGGK